MNDKYRFILENVVENIEKADIPFTENVKKLGEALLPFKEQIQKIYENFSSSNDDVIKSNMDSGQIVRVYLAKDTGSEISAERRIELAATISKTKSEIVTKSEPAAKSEHATKSDSDAVIKFEPIINPEPDAAVEPFTNVKQPAEKKADFDKERIKKDYELLIADYEEKIIRLEKDLVEYKRQHDELRTYSVGNYDRGVKDLFHILNDKRYGKPLNFLYQSLMFNHNLGANFRSILENFFMALEEMDIEPIIQIEKSVLADHARLKANCDLEFDIKNLVPEKVYFKYVGWKYKNTVIEKPTLAQKAD